MNSTKFSSKTTTYLKALKAQCERTIQCMEAFVEQNMLVANKFQELSQGAHLLRQRGQEQAALAGAKAACVTVRSRFLTRRSRSASSRMSQIKERLFAEVRACFTRASALTTYFLLPGHVGLNIHAPKGHHSYRRPSQGAVFPPPSAYSNKTIF